MKEVSQHLARTSVTRVEVGAFLDSMLPSSQINDHISSTNRFLIRREKEYPKSRNRVEELIETGLGTDIPGVKGSAWGVYNAYTEWLDHEKSIRGNSTNWERSTFGSGASDRSKALKALLGIT